MAKARDFKFCTLVGHVNLALGWHSVSNVGVVWSQSHDIFKFLKIKNSFSEMVQDSYTVRLIIRGLLNGTSISDLE